jgi:pyrimidine-specific ribonucleoside hydrolase
MNDPKNYLRQGSTLRLVLLLAALVFLLPSGAARAQTPEPSAPEPLAPEPSTGPGNLIPFLPRVVPSGSAAEEDFSVMHPNDSPLLYLPLVTGVEADAAQQPEQDGDLDASHNGRATVRLLVDTDPGVDDAVALAWLFGQRRVEVLGVVSVAGNTSVWNTTNNAITILEKLGRSDVPVVMGAAAPLVQPLSKTSYFIHGPDGLWFLGLQNPHDLTSVPRNAPAYYCATVAATPGLRLLALGPLTNIAQAVQLCPATMATVSQLVILGGAKFGGNKTPVAEFNFWQDPEAAAIVLNAGMPTSLVLLDAFTQTSITQKDLDKLFAKASPIVQFLAPAIQQYADVQIANTGRAGLPDAVAAVLALRPAEGSQQGALVRVVLEPGLARGQSVVGLAPSERIAMVADDSELSALADLAFAYPPDPNFNLQWALGAILMRAPENAQAVMSVPSSLLAKTVLPDLRAR